MNAISLYVSTSRLILQSDDGDDKNLADLYRLLPYLRQSLSCKFCGNLLTEPYSPNNSKCQHHVCKRCIDLRKTLKTSCMSCCDKQNFVENRQLRILLQCYKSLCEHIIQTSLYQEIRKQTLVSNKNGDQAGTSNAPTNSILDLIDEGAKFHDDFNSHTTGLSKSAYSILPCLYTTTQTNSSTQTLNNAAKFVTTSQSTVATVPLTSVSVAPTIPQLSVGNTAANLNTYSNPMQMKIKEETVVYQPTVMQQQTIQQPHQTTQTIQQQQAMSSPSVYSVLYAGSGNKITIKRKMENNVQPVVQTTNTSPILQTTVPTNFKKPTPTTFNTHIYKQKLIPAGTTVGQSINNSVNINSSNLLKRKGCRCGNATLTPGKLTCCGQRCPCYVESKSCIDCKCRGCRNPHHPNGFKVRPHLGGQNNQIVVSSPQTNQHNHQQIQTAQILQTYPTQASIIPTITSPIVSSTPTSNPAVTTQQIFINDLNQLQLAAPQTFQTNSCLPFTQFLNNTITKYSQTVTGDQSNHQTTYTTSNLQTTNFNQLLNNTIIFNPADIPTIIDGGSIQTAEIAIDL